ncbi:sensor histidine kinase [Clostridium tarantellae]|uniref:histidine kinase n=1 Tax=Clostridium tarantellae TaxID=39493 RepID=A0A6I1MSF2_9CLOT|nr:PAS domain-containing sensor histidine kinase [Clostridium tarantellae]MPQ43189.1 PAS domain S-box protein [Clostridium tarantellae]
MKEFIKSKKSKNISKIIKIMLISIAVIAMILVIPSTYINRIDINNITYNKTLFTEQSNLILSILAIISCWLYFYTYKKDEFFLITLMYTSFAFEYYYINIILMKLPRGFNLTLYYLILPYIFRSIYITLIGIKKNKLTKFIINHKISVSIVNIIITKILVDLDIYIKLNYTFNIRTLDSINIVIILYNILMLILLAKKSLDKKEPVYTAIIASIAIFIIKRIYSFKYIEKGNDLVEFINNTLVFLGFLVIILGIFIEMIRKVKESERLQRELNIFYSMSEQNCYSNLLIYNSNLELIYANKKAREGIYCGSKKVDYYELGEYFKSTVVKETYNKIMNEVMINNAWSGYIFPINEERVIDVYIHKIKEENNNWNIAVIFFDITDAHRISEEMKINEEKLRLINENIKDLIITIDNENNITYANNAALKVLGYLDEGLLGKNCCKLIFSKNDIENTNDCFVKHSIRKKNGQKLMVESMVSDIVNGDSIEKVIVSRDITYREEVEQLRLRYKEAKEYEKIKNEFFANLSHELRTPINIIYSCLQLLNLQKEKDQNSFNKCYIKYEKTMKQNCFRMLRLVNNLIDITKIDSGFMKMDFQNYDIVSLVENITDSVIPYVESKHINIIFDTEIEELEIKCDPEKIERVILNLLSNAVKFTPEYGNIFVYVSLENEYVKIMVKDDGIGVPSHMKDFIFERFMQTDKSLNRNQEGSGIGLALVKSIIELSGGQVYLNLKVKKGSEFIVKLPNVNWKGTTENKIDINYKPTVEKISIEFADIYDIY